MVSTIGRGNKFDVEDESERRIIDDCLIFSQGDGRLVILSWEISNSGKEAGIGGNDDEISHVKVKMP